MTRFDDLTSTELETIMADQTATPYLTDLLCDRIDETESELLPSIRERLHVYAWTGSRAVVITNDGRGLPGADSGETLPVYAYVTRIGSEDVDDLASPWFYRGDLTIEGIDELIDWLERMLAQQGPVRP